MMSEAPPHPRSLFVFGPGYVGLAFARRLAAQGSHVSVSARSAAGMKALTTEGVEAVDLADTAAMTSALAGADAILVTAPPDEHGCPAIGPVAAALAPGGETRPWIGYLSSTGVYGDRGGGWVFERSALRAQSVSGARRVAAEHAWLTLAARTGAQLAVFRLPGIYGPGRSAFDRLREGVARRIVRPGQVFSRIHRDDLCDALQAAIARPTPAAIYNLCDDEPAPPQDVVAHAAALLAVAPPPEVAFDTAELPGASRRFFEESKRVSNARAKAALDWRPAFPSYREGLAAILAGEGR
jgi:nucleoside-diphosphate-sugar epimerase